MERSLDGVRSKLHELRKDSAAFERKSWTWREEMVQRLYRKAGEEEKDENKTYDLMWWVCSETAYILLAC